MLLTIGIRNTRSIEQRIRNPSPWNPESKPSWIPFKQHEDVSLCKNCSAQMVSLFPYIIFWAAVIAITTGWGYPNFLRICPGCGCTFILVLLIYTLNLWHRSAFACVFEYTVFPRISVHALISALSRISAHPKAIYQISAPSPISVSLPFPSLS